MVNINKIALIPTYEPTKEFLKLLYSLSQKEFEIIIVNDGSSKEYEEIFMKAQKYAKVISYETNKGKGIAIKIGLKYIKKFLKSPYIVITMDCDGQHTALDANKLYEEALKNKETLVIGKRIRNEETPIKSKLGNGITRFIYRILTKTDIYDTQTGLRAFQGDLIDFLLEIEGERYEYEMNVLLKCSKNNIKVKEVEIETIYVNNNSNSHFKPFKDSIQIYKQIIKFSFSSLISFVIDYMLYIVFNIISQNIIFSNILARIISSTVNYNINKRMVFKSNKKIYKSFTQYFLLVILILVLNTLMLNLFVNILLINKYLAKIVIELTLFFISWMIQKKIIF